MVIRRERKLKKYLGTRTRGGGNTENRRGRGSKGGTGFTGKFGHKKNKFMYLIGTKDKNRHLSFDEPITFNTINEFLYNQKKNPAEKVELDFSKDKELKKYTKIVAKGDLLYKIFCKNVKTTKRAKEEIEKKGGSVE